MVDWQTVDTVLLDMDGTLLDLHFDNHFWLAHVPRRYAERRGIEFDASKDELIARYAQVAGTLDWYCVEFWTRELELDIALLKEEIAHLIAVHPHVEPFLAALRAAGKRVVLVTNAHHKSIALKMAKTGLAAQFDAIVCAHDFGLPKEHPEFWGRLQAVEPFDPARTLLIEDSLPVLRAARGYGIAQLLVVRKPDSRQPEKPAEGFASIASFAEIALPQQ